MSFWATQNLTQENLDKLGPLVDGIVGTNGQYQDLYEAMSDPGGPQWNRVFVLPGATLSDHVVKTSVNYVAIIGIGKIEVGGTKCIILNNCKVGVIENIRLDNVVTGAHAGAIASIGASGERNRIKHCSVYGSDAIGIYLENEFNWLIDCIIDSCAGDGVDIAAGSPNPNWISQCKIIGNGGWGIQDNADNCFITDNIVTGNSSGQIDSSSSYEHNNKES